MKKNLLLLLSLFLALSFIGCAAQPAPASAPAEPAAEPAEPAAAPADASELPEVHITAAIMLADDHPHTIAAKEVMAKMVSEATGGKFTIDVQNNGTMGSDKETTEACIMGNIEMTLPAAATLASFDPNWYILDVPYVFTSPEMARAALDGELGAFLSKSLEDTCGLICLGQGESGMRNLSNNLRPVHALADIKGMKVRTLENKYHLATFQALGTNPTPMAFAEVYTALQTNQIDGQDNAITITYTNKFYEVQKYYTEIQHLFNGNTYLINAGFYNSLPAEYQKILADAVQAAVVEQRRLVDENEDKFLEEMKASGCEVNALTGAEKAEFIAATQSVRDQFVAEFGQVGQQMLDMAAKYAAQ